MTEPTALPQGKDWVWLCISPHVLELAPRDIAALLKKQLAFCQNLHPPEGVEDSVYQIELREAAFRIGKYLLSKPDKRTQEKVLEGYAFELITRGEAGEEWQQKPDGTLQPPTHRVKEPAPVQAEHVAFERQYGREILRKQVNAFMRSAPALGSKYKISSPSREAETGTSAVADQILKKYMRRGSETDAAEVMVENPLYYLRTEEVETLFQHCPISMDALQKVQALRPQAAVCLYDALQTLKQPDYASRFAPEQLAHALRHPEKSIQAGMIALRDHEMRATFLDHSVEQESAQFALLGLYEKLVGVARKVAAEQRTERHALALAAPPLPATSAL